MASDIKTGKKQEALKKIENYYDEQEAVNTVVGSASVADNLDHDLNELKTMVKDTFEATGGSKPKTKIERQVTQYEGYRGRRIIRINNCP